MDNRHFNKGNPNKGIPDGSIITLKLKDKVRGVDLKKRKIEPENKDGKKKRNYFRNSVTIVMIIDDKIINFKISRNGKFQMTGCKFDEHAERCVKYIWSYLKNTDIYQFNNNNSHLIVRFVPAMRNIDFDLGFKVNREKLDWYINMKTNYVSLLETSFGYTGVNIKIPITKPILELKLKQIEYKDDKWSNITYVSYKTYLDTLDEKERLKKLNKKRRNTFLVFHSGKVIFSSINYDFMVGPYRTFIGLIRECYNIIEERLDP